MAKRNHYLGYWLLVVNQNEAIVTLGIHKVKKVHSINEMVRCKKNDDMEKIPAK